MRFNKTSSEPRMRHSYDKSFEILLYFLGLRLDHHIKLSLCKRLFSPLSLALHSSFVYCGYTLFGQTHFPPPKLHVFTFICYFLSIALWHHMLLTSKSFKRFMVILQNRNITLNNTKVRKFSRIAMATAILFPVVLATSIIIPVRIVPHEEYVLFWLWEYRNHDNPVLEFILLYVSMIVFYALKFTLPSMFVATLGIINLQLSDAVRQQTRNIEVSILEGNLGEEIEKYQNIVYCCEKFRDCSKGTMLLLCSLYFTMMYTGLGVVLYKDNDVEIVAILESVFTISGSVFSVVNLLGFGSGIPEAMEKASNRFQFLFRRILLQNGAVSAKDLMLLKSVGEMKPVYLTVGDLMLVKKSLILSSFGCTVTYCLLIMQLNPNSPH